MSAERRIMAGACLLCAGVVVGCVQAWLAVTGRAPVVSGLSLLAVGLGGLGAGLMSLAEVLMSHRRMQELLGQLAADGDESAVAVAEYLRIDIPDGREQ